MIKDKRIYMRVTETLKNEMKIEAKKNGLSVTNYLIFLHCQKIMEGNKIA
jgi:predicted DNA binding CopG/RHH family protein